MDRIKLSKREKQVLRLLDKGFSDCPNRYPAHIFSICVYSLQSMGFVDTRHDTTRLTDAGKVYIALNPYLRNPIDWAKVAAVASCVAVIVAVVALLVSCSMLNQ